MPDDVKDALSRPLISNVEISRESLCKLIGKKLIMHNASFDVKFVKCFYDVDLLSSLYVDFVCAFIFEIIY